MSEIKDKKIVGKEKRHNWLMLVILLTVIFFLGLWFIFSSILPISSDFENNLWRPSYLLLHKMSPYKTDVMFDGLKPIWFPVIIGLFFPLGAIPLYVASNLWFIFGVLCLFLMVAIAAREFNVKTIFIAIFVIAIILFPSTLAHFKLGQVTLFITMLLLLLIKYRTQLASSIIGLLLALSLIKPQLIVIFLPLYFYCLYRAEGLRKLLWVVFYTAVWVLVFTIPLFVLYPNWIPDFLKNLSNNPFWSYPTPYAYFQDIFSIKVTAMVLAGIYLLGGIGIALVLSHRLNSNEVLLWSLALTPVFSPVIWSWDFVLMYPLMLHLAFNRRIKSTSNIVIIGYGICLTLFILMKNLEYTNDKYAVWVPLFLIGILSISQIIQRKSNVVIA